MPSFDRVIDVEFVANRAIVLGTVAAFLTGTFVLLDWLYANYLTQTRWQIAVGIGVAFALGWGGPQRAPHAHPRCR